MAKQYESIKDGINLFTLDKINNDFKYLFESIQILEDFKEGENVISSNMLTDGAVTRDKIDFQAVNNYKISDGAVSFNKLSGDVRNRFTSVSESVAETKKLIDELVLESGQSDTEVIQARGQYELLGERLNADEKLNAERSIGTGEMITNKPGLYNISNTKGTMVILDDDTRKQSYDILYQWAKEKNVPITLAANSDSILDPDSNRINIDQFIEMKDDPLVEFVNHTATHARLTELTEEQIHDEIKRCEDFLMSFGIYTKHLVYPYGAVNDTIKKIAKEYVYSSSKSDGRIINPNAVLDSMQLSRVVFETPIQEFQNRINEAVNNNGCVLINSHSQYETFNIEKLDEIVNRAKAAGLEIVHYSQAFKNFGNSLEIRDSINNLVGGVSATGKAEGIFVRPVKTEESSAYKFSDGPEVYENRVITTTHNTRAQANANGWEALGPGVLIVDRRGPDDYTHQLYMPINSSKIYRRSWDVGNGRWTDFRSPTYKNDVEGTFGPYTLEPGMHQNIVMNDPVFKLGKPIIATLNTLVPNTVQTSSVLVTTEGRALMRMVNVSNDITYTIPEGNYIFTVLD